MIEELLPILPASAASAVPAAAEDLAEPPGGFGHELELDVAGGDAAFAGGFDLERRAVRGQVDC